MEIFFFRIMVAENVKWDSYLGIGCPLTASRFFIEKHPKQYIGL